MTEALLYMARQGSLQIRKLYQIKTIDTTVHTVESPCMHALHVK